MREFNFYIDDSGTRNPDKRPAPSSFGGDWFALGGIIVPADEEQHARDLYAAFCGRWDITYPLHSVKIRHRSDRFTWLGQLEKSEANRFFKELDELIRSAPVWALACVIDRPGYNARYAERYGKDRWSLCNTAFPIIAERATKFVVIHDARLRLYVERSDKKSEALLRQYFNELRIKGMPFAAGGDAKYQPIAAEVMRARLYDLKFKFKSSPMVQLADLMLYPLCKGGYEPEYRPLSVLRDAGKLLEATLPPEMVSAGGTKYSCFDG